MTYTKKPPSPHVRTGRRPANWIRGVLESSNVLVPAIEWLVRSYKVFLFGKSITDAEIVLTQVEGALRDAERSRCALQNYVD